MVDAREILEALAARQNGVFALWQAADAGIARSTVHFWHGRGELRRVMRGIYHLKGAGLSLREEQTAIMLRYRLDPRVAFSHFSALSHYGIGAPVMDRHHLTVPEGIRRHRKLGAVRFHSLPLAETDTVLDGVIRYTSPLLTLHDLAAWGYPHAELAHIHARMLRKGLLGSDSLDLVAAEEHRFRGNWRLNFHRYLQALGS